MMKTEISFSPIGFVKSPYQVAEGTPIQSHLGQGNATIEIDPCFLEGLTDLDGFSHIYVISHLNRVKYNGLLIKPFLDDERRGVFATRSPSRPNPIGLSIVELIKVDGCILHVGHIDLLDGTPVLDIKPYIKRFDVFETTKEGWFDNITKPMQHTRDDGRFV